MKRTLKIATRSSKLALWQADWVKSQIEALHSEVTVELIHLKTKGDKILDSPLAKIGGKGLFVKELENAILENEADIAVHSMKDVPTELPQGLEISVVTKREVPGDAFVSNGYSSFDSLPERAVVGTSSLRRIAQLQKLRPDLEFRSLRGNVNTRLKKLDDGEYDAIILAAAGLIRLDLADRITELIPHDISLPAIGQGAICIESRIGDASIMELITPLKDEETTVNVSAERALLERLNGGCQVPIAGHAVTQNGRVTLTGLLASPDGTRFLKMSESGPITDCESIGQRLGEKLLKDGGREILAEVGIQAP
ncbi:MAG: hydroxymethylbilane synthase [Proteobacteria bacterium]|nr:hydroxymethylbilane synthase [Pseudomonadota bacterium]